MHQIESAWASNRISSARLCIWESIETVEAKEVEKDADTVEAEELEKHTQGILHLAPERIRKAGSGLGPRLW